MRFFDATVCAGDAKRSPLRAIVVINTVDSSSCSAGVPAGRAREPADPFFCAGGCEDLVIRLLGVNLHRNGLIPDVLDLIDSARISKCTTCGIISNKLTHEPPNTQFQEQLYPDSSIGSLLQKSHRTGQSARSTSFAGLVSVADVSR